MMYCDFATTTHGKWILVGEHAVLRGHPALVFPVNEKKLVLNYQASNLALTIDYMGDDGTDIRPLLRQVLDHGMQILKRPMDSIRGHFKVQSNIPVGVGMGASAALCVAVSRWFFSQHFLPSVDIQFFAKKLEDLFHGQSSGLDIAGAAATSGIYFKEGISEPIKQTWKPQWFLSTCGQVGMTAPCIKAVNALWQTDTSLAKAIDLDMHNSVLGACAALENNNIPLLAKAINQAADCFQKWGLISSSLQEHMQRLRNAGAIAVKPTGSGGGGYVLSLWDTAPNPIDIELIPG